MESGMASQKLGHVPGGQGASDGGFAVSLELEIEVWCFLLQ